VVAVGVADQSPGLGRLKPVLIDLSVLALIFAPAFFVGW
jgi:hypothetical protein